MLAVFRNFLNTWAAKAFFLFLVASFALWGVADVLREIESEPSVERVDEAQFWQVHYGLCMANLKLSVARGCDDAALSPGHGLHGPGQKGVEARVEVAARPAHGGLSLDQGLLPHEGLAVLVQGLVP